MKLSLSMLSIVGSFLILTGAAKAEDFICSNTVDRYGNQDKMVLSLNSNGKLIHVARISGWHWCSDRKVKSITPQRENTYKLSYLEKKHEFPCSDSYIKFIGKGKIHHSYDNNDFQGDAPVESFNDILNCVKL